jgi:hypothetical protein
MKMNFNFNFNDRSLAPAQDECQAHSGIRNEETIFLPPRVISRGAVSTNLSNVRHRGLVPAC